MRSLRVALLIVTLSCPALSPAQTAPETPFTPAAAARQVASLYRDAERRVTFFCDCGFNDAGEVFPASCGFSSEASVVRLAWSPVVPVSRMGRGRECWEAPGNYLECHTRRGLLERKKCCRKVDVDFAQMECDLMNLRPVIAALERERGDAAFGEVEGEPREFGRCDFEVKGEVAEPDASDRGEIARTYLYYEKVWDLKLSSEERERYERWNAEDPPDAWERERARRIAEIQGVANPAIAGDATAGPRPDP